MNDLPGASHVPADPGSWVRAALGELEDSPAPVTAIRKRGRNMRIRRRVAVAVTLTGTVAAALALAANLMGLTGARHDVPAHHGHARPPVRLQPAGAPMIAAQVIAAQCAALSPDGRTLVVGDDSGPVFSFRLADRHLLSTLPPDFEGDGVVSVAFSPNGRYLAVAYTSGHIFLWSTASHRVVNQFSFIANPSVQYQVAFSPDSATLAAAYGNGQLARWQLSGHGRPVVLTPPGPPRRPPPGTLTTAGLAFSPDGRQIVVFDVGELDVWSVTGSGGRLVRQIKGVTGYSLQYGPAGTIIAVGGDRGTALVDAASGRRTAFLRDPAGFRVYALAFSADGSTLAAADGNNSIFLWNTDHRTVTAILRHPSTDGGEMWVGFTPDGKSVVALTGNYSRVWKLDQRGVSPAPRAGG